MRFLSLIVSVVIMTVVDYLCGLNLFNEAILRVFQKSNLSLKLRQNVTFSHTSGLTDYRIISR
jgi:hypothetical protein